MASLAAVVTAFVATLINTVHKDRVAPGAPTIFGLSRMSAAMIVVILLGLGFACYREVQVHESDQRREAREQRLVRGLDALTARLTAAEASAAAVTNQATDALIRERMFAVQQELTSIRDEANRLDADDDDDGPDDD